MLDTPEKAKVFQRHPDLSAMKADPFGYLDYDHSAQRALADHLEALADSLPDCVNRAAAAMAAAMLRTVHARHAEIEDRALFPMLESRCRDEVTQRAIRIARKEHEDAAGKAIELAEALDGLAETGRAPNSESLGFMLRAFFDGLRRHLDWVDAAILPQARRALGAAERAELGVRLAALLEGRSVRGACGLAVIDGARA